METENITKAAQTVELLVSDLRAAHHDAIACDNRFAEIVMIALLAEAAALKDKLGVATAAAGL